MRGRRVSELLSLPVRLRGIQLGRRPLSELCYAEPWVDGDGFVSDAPAAA